MADFSALQNTPIIVDLLTVGRATGWTVDTTTGIATHQTCNVGKIRLTGYPVTALHTYKVSYIILSVTAGTVRLTAGGTNGVSRSTTGLFVETIVATGTDPIITFYSDANAQIQTFNVLDITNEILGITDAITYVYSATNKKWCDFRNFYPSFGVSQFERTFTFLNGDMWGHQNGSNDTNNFYGTQFQSIIKLAFAKNSGIIKGFEALNYQANQLMVTTQDGITTSIGQVSTLTDEDMLKAVLDDGVTQVNIYQNYNVYSASFQPDSNDDDVNGADLKGNYIIVELITTDASTLFSLYSVGVKSAYVPIGSR